MSFRDRLRRLRREEAEGVAGGPTDPASEQADRASLADESNFQVDPAPVRDRGTPSCARTDAGPPRDLTPFEGPFGPGEARVTLFDADYRHGDFPLDEVASADRSDFVLFTGDESLSDLDLEDAVYLDTETTGLSGGAGTYVFQIGLGRFIDTPAGRRFEVWQGFLHGPEGEQALLGECARRIAESSGVVSFFGKSFDRHRLEDKMTLCGVPAPFDAKPHLDLYHPCRRLYRGAYSDGRLKTMEHELCGLEREDDLPGSEAPEAWFDFLAKRAHRLEGVFRHNLDDVLSLVGLTTHIGRSRFESRANGEPLSGDPRTRALGISRSLAATLDRATALTWMDLAIERGALPLRGLQRERADLQRLGGMGAEAILSYRELVAAPPDRESVPSLLELAKLLEHHESNHAGALECCRCAAELIEDLHTGPEYARLVRDLRKRTARLSQKVTSKK